MKKLGISFLLLCLLIVTFLMVIGYTGTKGIPTESEQKVIAETTSLAEVKTPVEEITEKVVIEEEVPIIEPIVVVKEIKYRLTSFYSNDGAGTGSCTGSGLCENDFIINDKGWYTYQGKLVLAGATQECLRATRGACGNWNTPIEGRHYFHYKETIKIIIDGITYEGIILDSCGASMFLQENRIDLFVSNKNNTIDRGYRGNNMITVIITED